MLCVIAVIFVRSAYWAFCKRPTKPVSKALPHRLHEIAERARDRTPKWRLRRRYIYIYIYRERDV